MLEQLSRHIATTIKKIDPDGPTSIEVMSYELGIRLNYLATIILTITMGLLTRDLWGSLFALISFVLIRKLSGGFHMKSLTACAIMSALIFSTIPKIDLNTTWIFILTAIQTIIYILHSPNHMIELNPSKSNPFLMKLLSVLVCLINLILQSPILALTLMVQAILILPWKGVLNDDETKNSSEAV
ncbi:accessory gene regulator B family protein [Paenibacillus lautus]|uniref:accessory gene regulator ArgB-like protein n=1 Tax=Paenibacillus lautus TaxID=1401 RepID=UPI003D29EF7D